MNKNKRAGKDEGVRRWFGFWPRLGLLILLCIGLIALAGWLWRGAWPRAQRARLETVVLDTTNKLGFSIRQVTVEGRRNTGKKELLDALGLASKEPILAFDPHGAHDRLMALPWTRSVTILRLLPDRIVVLLTERQPFARWQKQDKTFVIDTDGTPLEAARVDDFAALPLIIGDATPEQMRDLLALLSAFPDIARRLKGAARVSERRWNLHLTPDVTVRLPEHDPETAMRKLAKMIETEKILDLGVKTIDLRLPEKVYIEPSSSPSGEKRK